MPLSETVLVVAGLLTLSIVAAGLCRRLPVPYTVLLVLLGMLLAEAAGRWPALAPVASFRLTPELVLFVFLPALIFESAFNLSARQLIKDFAPVMMLAIPALLLSTAIIGIGLWWLLGLPLVVALVFGALISATDPVAVIALFKELGAPARLTVLVEGESLLNDATAIVLYKILLAIALTGALGWGVAGGAAWEFVRVFAGGALVGAVLGYAASEIVHRLRSGPSALIVMTFAAAYTGFGVAEHALHVSGVMAVMAAALVFAALGVARMPHETIAVVRETWDVVALVANSLLFLMIGLSVRPAELAGSLGAIGAAVVLMLAARAAGVYTLVPATVRTFRLPRVSAAEQHIMVWGGLRGGLAIAIVLSMPEELPGRELLMHMALGAVLFTLLVNATTVRPLIHRLGIDRMTPDEDAELKDGLAGAEREALAIVERFHAAGLASSHARHLVRRKAEELFEVGAPQLDSAQRARRAHLDAVRAESEALEALHEQALLDPYTYLDLRETLERDRETRPQEGTDPPRVFNPFLRLETALVGSLRERDWAAGLLARYQSLRVAQRLERDIAGVVTAQAALEGIARNPELDAATSEAIAAPYRERLCRRRRRIEAIRSEFPDFYERFESWLFERAMLAGARRWLERARHNGEIGAKAYSRIAPCIEQALEALPRAAYAAPRPSPHVLIGLVPLFSGLPPETLQEAARRAQAVTFLAGDVIIGEGDRGDALYVVSRGRVAVHRKAPSGELAKVVELGVGDFFGEHALLGDHVRTATVTAATPCTLLRLTTRAVKALAEVDPDVARRLREADRARRG